MKLVAQTEDLSDLTVTRPMVRAAERLDLKFLTKGYETYPYPLEWLPLRQWAGDQPEFELAPVVRELPVLRHKIRLYHATP